VNIGPGAAFARLGWVGGLVTGVAKAWRPLLVWTVFTLAGLFISGFLNNLLDLVSGRHMSQVTLFGQGQLLNPTAILATGAVGRLLWQAGAAPPALRLIVGVGAILTALFAVGMSVDQHVAGSIATELTNSAVSVPRGTSGGWLAWIISNNLLPTADVTATMSEWLYGTMFVTGGFCVVLSEAK